MALGRKTGGRQKGSLNKATASIKAAIQKHGEALVKALLALTKSDDERVRLGAIQAALDRGWGKPTQAVDLGAEVQITSIEMVIVGMPKVIEAKDATGDSESDRDVHDIEGALTR